MPTPWTPCATSDESQSRSSFIIFGSFKKVTRALLPFLGPDLSIHVYRDLERHWAAPVPVVVFVGCPDNASVEPGGPVPLLTGLVHRIEESRPASTNGYDQLDENALLEGVNPTRSSCPQARMGKTGRDILGLMSVNNGIVSQRRGLPDGAGWPIASRPEAPAPTGD